MAQKDKIKSFSKRGFTLSEVGIVMAVVGIILAGIWQLYSNAKESQKEADAVQEAQIISKNMVNFMQGRSFQAALVGTEITSKMIAAQAIPQGYINLTTPTEAGHPWNGTGLKIFAMAGKTFRLSFYSVTYQGCLTLLEAITACDSTQSGCPTAVYTDEAGKTCLPGLGGCVGSTGIDWQVINSTTATTLCSANSYTGGLNSVEFDFSL